MADYDAPTLEVGFAIETAGAFADLLRLENVIDDATARAIKEFAAVELASRSMLDLSGATLQMKSFGSAATKEAQAVAVALSKAEKAGEALSRQIDRQTSTFGKSREELRAMKVEASALAAEQSGLTELASRLRTQQAALVQMQGQAAAAAAAEAAAIREAGQAYQMFEARARAGAQAMREVEAAQKAAALAADAAGIREAAQAYQMFEARARSGAQAMREVEAAQKATDRDIAATKLRVEADAVRKLGEEHARLAGQVRASHAAQLADADSAERLRASTDPLYAATKRLNAEIAESTRLYHSGAIAPAEYARQQDVLTGRLHALSAANDTMAVSAKRGAGTLTQLSFQINDVATMAAMGAPPFQIFASQIGQIVQVGQMAEGGMKGFALQIGALALAFMPVIAVLSVAGVAFMRWQDQINDTAANKNFADSLGLTEKELKKLGSTSVTTGDTLRGLWKTISDGFELDGAGKKIMDMLFGPNDAQIVGEFIGDIYGLFVGGYKAIIEIWNKLPAALGDLFYSTVNLAIQAVEMLVNKSIEAVNGFSRRANDLLGTNLFGTIDSVQIDRVKNTYAGAATDIVGAFSKNFEAEKKTAIAGMAGFFSDVEKNSILVKNARLKAKADELKEARSDKSPKADRRAENLARDIAATEAQIKNLYGLADAYRVSNAAALIAEARTKATSAAIKQRGDVETAVDRQIRLSIAQRVSDAAKSSASVRDQAAAQAFVNAQVLGGLVPAERANDLLQARISDLPLLAALEVANQRGLKTEAEKATQALKDQAQTREDLRRAAVGAVFNADMASGNDRLDELREEARLIGATDAERVKALATLRAMQEATAKGYDPTQAAAYIAQQVGIAVQQQANTDAQREYNDALNATSVQWDLIARNVDIAAQGMATAFGRVGEAIGGLASIFSSYRAEQVRADVEHQQRLKAAVSEQAKARELARYQLQTATAQVGTYGDMSSAAKGFFKEGSDGYKAMATAEKAFRAVEFALSVRAMAQDVVETGVSIANSGARTAVKAVEAVVTAISTLPFPLNLAAGAATIAALASIGVAIAGSFGGSGGKVPASNDGSGTVFGDSAAKSESIKRAIDGLKDIDVIMLGYSREMSASPKSIDSQIGSFAALVLRTGDVNASAGVNTGFATDTSGKILSGLITGGGVLSKIPVLGSVIGAIGSVVKSLFGSKTSVVGSGLFGNAQSLGGILANGFDAEYYSDIKKKKKAFGITTSTKYSTQFSSADPGLENQFTLILRQFNEAIAASAAPLGESTEAIQKKLNGFVVNIGKIDLQGLSGEQIEEKLTAVFGAAADNMANAAFPGLQRFQAVGEGLFDTLVRVASTAELVTSSLTMLGSSFGGLTVDLKMTLADQFESLSALSSAVDGYFSSYYTASEQAAAKTAQFSTVFASLGLSMPSTLAGFRALVEAQDLTTAAGQATYATLLQLAPAFAELQSALTGAKSAADILSERADLERRMLELLGDTAAIRALDLAKLDATNRPLQAQIWALQDAQAAASSAEKLAEAWGSVGKTIQNEIDRIRGLTSTDNESFATLMGRFNATTAAARAGDQDAAGALAGLSQSLLAAAALSATSRQELERVQAQTASSLEATLSVVNALAGGKSVETTLANAAAASSASSGDTDTANETLLSEIVSLRLEVVRMREENTAGHAATAGNTGAVKRHLDAVTQASGGEAISTVAAA